MKHGKYVEEMVLHPAVSCSHSQLRQINKNVYTIYNNNNALIQYIITIMLIII